jgi:GntR family transcriptional repressor for pyruvate dehydrogenase complex
VDIELHETLFHLTGNSVLISGAKFVTDLLEHSVRLGRRVLFEGGLDSTSLLQQHLDIVEAVCAGEPARAARAMRDHMGLVLDFYMERYPEPTVSAEDRGTG